MGLTSRQAGGLQETETLLLKDQCPGSLRDPAQRRQFERHGGTGGGKFSCAPSAQLPGLTLSIYLLLALLTSPWCSPADAPCRTCPPQQVPLQSSSHPDTPGRWPWPGPELPQKQLLPCHIQQVALARTRTSLVAPAPIPTTTHGRQPRPGLVPLQTPPIPVGEGGSAHQCAHNYSRAFPQACLQQSWSIHHRRT